jgi:hypothetical protein
MRCCAQTILRCSSYVCSSAQQNGGSAGLIGGETRGHRIVFAVYANNSQGKLPKAASLEKANKYQSLFPLSEPLGSLSCENISQRSKAKFNLDIETLIQDNDLNLLEADVTSFISTASKKIIY